MALANDLLTQSRALLGLDLRKPKQANLRRGLSTAYYALFHLLVADAVGRFVPKSPPGPAPRVSRAFAHAEMRQVCQSIASGNTAAIVQPLVPAGFSAELQSIARAFVYLQDARHKADYDVAATYSKAQSLAAVDEAAAAFIAWQSVRKNDEANVFLSALLFHNRWAK